MRLSFVGASLGLAISSLAQDPQADFAIKPTAAFETFKKVNGGDWVVQWSRATGTPSSIYGTGLSLADWRENTLEEGRRHALRLLQDNRDLLGLGTSDFTESIGARMGRTWSFVFDQSFRGLPVIGGRADVRINMKGVVAMLGSEAVQIPAAFPIVPTIGEALAVATAWNAVGAQTGVAQPGKPRAPRLVVWADLGKQDGIAQPVLAWEVPISNVDRNGFGPIGRYYVDANSAAVLEYRSDKHECGTAGCNATDHATPSAGPRPTLTTVTVMGWTNTNIDATAALVNTRLPGLQFTVPGVGTVTTDANGQFTIDIAAAVNLTVGALDGIHHTAVIDSSASGPTGTFTINPGVNSTIQLLSAAATTNQSAHPNVSYWIHTTNEWARSILGNTTQLDTASGISPTVNQTGTCNAYYTGNTVHFYPTGGGCNNTAFSTVVSHEWGHGLDERYGGISNATGDGLSEGWGDIIGCYLMDSPNLGQGFQTAGVALRSGNNTKTYGTQTEIHAAGEIWMGFAWKYRENLRTAFGTPAAIAISNATVIASIVANATNQAAAVQQVFIADDDDGNLLNGTPHYAQLSAAAITKGIPYPQIQVASITHFPLTNTTVRITPRAVNATVAPISAGTINAVRLVYNAGSGSATRNMKPNGAANGYTALLPGLSSGSVTYHLEADHSGGTTVRLPATGEYAYTVSAAVVGPFTGFYSESFTTATGWTTGLLVGTTQDWQLGAPNGKTGTSSGVAWTDPSAASANGNVYGTDLGAGTSNGAYINNRSYYLRSPVISCSGRSGCFLRFRRWLTVEEALYDQAAIYVNGQQVWVNQTNGHTIDTAWSTVEYAIPMADNNAAVQIEFRITTDAALALGGWNIDDFELGTKLLATLDAELRLLPEQAATGASMLASVVTPGNSRPFLLGLGDTAGPTSIPGIPTVLVGGNLDIVAGTTDASGNWSSTFSAPAVPSAVGLLFYSQVLTLDATYTNFVTSNQFLNLFTQTP